MVCIKCLENNHLKSDCPFKEYVSNYNYYQYNDFYIPRNPRRWLLDPSIEGIYWVDENPYKYWETVWPKAKIQLRFLRS